MTSFPVNKYNHLALDDFFDQPQLAVCLGCLFNYFNYYGKLPAMPTRPSREMGLVTLPDITSPIRYFFYICLAFIYTLLPSVYAANKNYGMHPEKWILTLQLHTVTLTRSFVDLSRKTYLLVKIREYLILI